MELDKLRQGHCIAGMSKIPAGSIDLAFADPPFNIGYKYDVYEGTVKIEAKVKRSAGDASPLEVLIEVQACDDRVCLEPGKLKLMIP